MQQGSARGLEELQLPFTFVLYFGRTIVLYSATTCTVETDIKIPPQSWVHTTSSTQFHDLKYAPVFSCFSVA